MNTNLIVIVLFLLLNCLAGKSAGQNHYKIQAISFDQVILNDKIWAPRVQNVLDKTIQHCIDKSRETGRIKNFEIAANVTKGSFCTTYAFDDSDVYKTIEAAAFALKQVANPKLENQVKELILLIGKAQEPDGYLYTWRTIVQNKLNEGSWNKKDQENPNLNRAGPNRWEHEDQHSHELYNAGHLFEAAVAWSEATGDDRLLKIALKNAELLLNTFGEGKLKIAPGHQEIELGLIKLSDYTGDKKYLQLAKFFLDARGYGEAYMQNHKKLKDQDEAVGHAVRAGYMFMAAADITARTGTTEYWQAMDRVWTDIVQKKMFVTGGVGSTGTNEGFSEPYDLPNYSAYCETCSSIAFVWWNQKMFQLTGESKYIDVLERTLYNALNAGISQDGLSFFYPNPLESRKNIERRDWYNCACCPPNLSRFYSSMANLIYATDMEGIYINLFVQSQVLTKIRDKTGKEIEVSVTQVGELSADNKMTFYINPSVEGEFKLKVRIPAWAEDQITYSDLYQFNNGLSKKVEIKLNGKTVTPQKEKGYWVFDTNWNVENDLEILFPIEVREIIAHPQVKQNIGKVAIQRGPLIYCLEGKDQANDQVISSFFPEINVTGIKGCPEELDECVQLKLVGSYVNSNKLSTKLTPNEFVATPYYLWANRGKDNMIVWLPKEIEYTRALNTPTLASSSKLSSSEGLKGNLESINDQWIPENSNDHSIPFAHWWPKFGTTEWLQYDFEIEQEIGQAKVYWFDDSNTDGGCRIPQSWRMLYLENNEWKPVYAHDGFSVTKDQLEIVDFEPVKTRSIRLEIKSKAGVSSGIYEWEIK